jgi:hypothetical protein
MFPDLCREISRHENQSLVFQADQATIKVRANEPGRSGQQDRFAGERIH